MRPVPLEVDSTRTAGRKHVEPLGEDVDQISCPLDLIPFSFDYGRAFLCQKSTVRASSSRRRCSFAETANWYFATWLNWLPQVDVEVTPPNPETAREQPEGNGGHPVGIVNHAGDDVLDVCSHFHALDIPVVILTLDDGDCARRLCAAAGAHSFVSKQSRVETLLAAVRNAAEPT